MADATAELEEIMAQAKVLAVRYRNLTGKPLGISGEIAEVEVARVLDLVLAPPRTKGYDAERTEGDRRTKIQIKGRAVDPADRRRGRVPSIRLNHEFDIVALALLDMNSLDLLEVWEASRDDVEKRLLAPGSKARNERGSLGISQFVSIAKKSWSADQASRSDPI
ncbi:MAG: hypothetical protein OEL76_11595 [Siculibacillus sp.]|nr:hypothetical protein [Siculibacillus sp.]